MAPRLVLIRHGQTEWSMTSRHTGRTDIPLTDVGREEAELAAASLTEWRFDKVFTSSLSRARETATIAGFGHATIDNDLLEWDYGEHEGRRTVDILLEHPDFSKWSERPPAGESVEEVGERVDRVIQRFKSNEASGDVALFAHGHTLAILIARWLELPASEGRRFPLSTATLTLLDHYRENPVLRFFNHRCGAPLAHPPTG
ncbi:MAG: histidine phosphatase family protein [Acidimicrobiales bacterium]